MNHDDMKMRWELYVKQVKNVGVDELLEKGMVTVEAVSRAVTNPNPFTITEALLSVARTMTGTDLYFYNILDSKGWKRMFPSCINEQLIELLEPHITSKISVGHDDEVVLVTKDGIRIGWVQDEDKTTDILAYVDNYEASVKFVRELLWSTIDLNRVVLNKDKSKGEKYEQQIRIVTDDITNSVNSELAEQLSDDLKAYASHGIKRTILFHGRPGSGKSTLTRTICEKLNARSLRIRVEDVGQVSVDFVRQIIDIVQPNVVIFDDLDRSQSVLTLFEMLEMLHKKVNVVFATVNHLESLTEALKRPGRFDDIVHVSKLDELTVMKLLGEYSDVYSIVKDWPVAFIKEYVIRRNVFGKERALNGIKELQERLAYIESSIGIESNTEEE